MLFLFEVVTQDHVDDSLIDDFGMSAEYQLTNSTQKDTVEKKSVGISWQSGAMQSVKVKKTDVEEGGANRLKNNATAQRSDD